ncbi:hypothetical protein GCM10010329_63170 [Streptomyces spiroverticillatus]|nr:hypothetical protein GCM10010329_63170 [Streptomyces spiroverticillatus]
MAGYSGGGETRRYLGIWALIIGLLLLFAGGCASKDAESPRCGGERMESGDACVGSGSYSGYEEKKDEAGQAAYWLLRVGGVLAAGGAAVLVVGSVADSAWRLRSAARRRSGTPAPSPSPATDPLSGLLDFGQVAPGPRPTTARPAPAPAPRPRPRPTTPAPRAATPAPRPSPAAPTLRDQLAEEIGSVQFPASRLQPGYDRQQVDTFLTQIRVGLQGKGPAVGPAQIAAAALGTAGHRQTGYDRQAVDAFLTALASSLRSGE